MRFGGFGNYPTGFPTSSRGAFPTGPKISGSVALLDTFPVVAFAAWSIARLVRSAYTGPLITVRNSGGGTVDVYARADGALDTGYLLAQLGPNSGFITTIYDQTGNGRHLTQATAAQQLQIVNAGALNAKNGRAVGNGRFGSASQSGALYDAGSNINFTGLTSSAVAYINSLASTNFKRILSSKASADANDFSSAASMIFTLQDSANAGMSNFSGVQQAISSGVVAGQLFQAIGDWNGTTYGMQVDQNARGTAAGGTTKTLRYFCIGDLLDAAASLDGGVSEAIIWQSALSSTDRATLNANNKAFYGTP